MVTSLRRWSSGFREWWEVRLSTWSTCNTIKACNILAINRWGIRRNHLRNLNQLILKEIFTHFITVSPTKCLCLNSILKITPHECFNWLKWVLLIHWKILKSYNYLDMVSSVFHTLFGVQKWNRIKSNQVWVVLKGNLKLFEEEKRFYA